MSTAPPATPVNDMDLPIIDQAALQQVRDLQPPGAPDLLDRLVKLFRSSSSVQVATLQHAADTANAGVLGDTAHALKSAAANLGARQLAALAASLETAARAGNVEEAASLVTQLTEAHQAAVAALERVTAPVPCPVRGQGA